MLRILTKLSLLGLLLGLPINGRAFSLLGPFAVGEDGGVWQVPRIGYNIGGDIGGPMNVAAGEEYRWNTPVVFYAYDAAFLDFFGSRGVEELEKAIKIYNDLPPASLLNVDDYPMTAERLNPRASALGLVDLKSVALKALSEEIGLTSPNRWIYCLRNRLQPGPNRFPVFFNMIRRNYDPITAAESSFINGRLWDVQAIFDLDNPAWSYTASFPVDPLDQGRFDPVASIFDTSFGAVTPTFAAGTFFTGFTRDDVGAIKYAYQHNNRNFEAVIPGSTNAGFGAVVGGSAGPWTIPSTNVVAPGQPGAGGLIDPAVRFGVDKVTFVRTEFDSILGQVLTPVVSGFAETVFTNSVAVGQNVQRLITVPDILISAGDLQLSAEPGIIPAVVYARSTTAGWNNSDGLTRPATHAGPGTIRPSIFITFNNSGFLVPVVIPGSPGAVTWLGSLPSYVFGAFDGTTNEPVVFSPGGNITVQQLENLRLGR